MLNRTYRSLTALTGAFRSLKTSIKKRKAAVLVPLFLFVSALAGCAGEGIPPADTSEDAYQTAVTEGILAGTGAASEDGEVYNRAAAERKNMNRSVGVEMQLYAPTRRELFFERDNGRLQGVYVLEGQEVSQNELLAEVVFDRAALQAEREQLTVLFNQYEEQFANGEASWRNKIAEIENSLITDMTGHQEEIRRLEQTKLELEYERFLFRDRLTRADYTEQLEDIDERLAGERILAPFDGIIQYVSPLKTGALIRDTNRMIVIVSDGLLQFTVEAPVDTVRYGDIFNVKTVRRDSEISFDVRVVSDPVATDARQGEYIYQAEPVDQNAFKQTLLDKGITLVDLSYLKLTGSPTVYDLENALVVPRSAINREDQKAYVNLLEDGIIKKRYVQLGINFMDEQQILDGLEEGQEVILTP